MTSVRSLSSRVVDAVARSKAVDTTDLPPLYETLDPDALDALCSSYANGTGGDALSIQFTYAGRDVVVRPSEDVEVRALGSDHGSA